MGAGNGQKMDGSGGQGVRTSRIGALLEVVIAHPPVNALGVAVRQGLAQALDFAEVDNSAAVLIRGEGGLFSAGADIGEFGQDRRAAVPSLGALCRRVEMLEKPVVVLLSGAALGGGLELALAAHLRLAEDRVQLALPEVLLGLLPGAGGTQRLPRLAGAAVALDLMLSGRVIGAAEAVAMGIVDRVLTEDAVAGARAAALALAKEGGWRRVCDRDEGFRDRAAYRAAVAGARAAQAGARLPAPGRIVDCVEAALLLPFERGLDFEGAAFGDLMATAESAGLRRAFRAERVARKVPAAVAGVTAALPQRLAIWGAEGAAAGIAQRALGMGFAVQLADPSREALVAALERIASGQEAEVAAGRMTAEARDADWARLTPVVGAARLPEAEAVIALRDDLALPAPRTVMALAGGGGKGAVPVTLVPGTTGLAEMDLTGADLVPARAAQAVALAGRLGWDVVPVGPGGPVAVHLATALAEAVAQLEGRGAARGMIAQALALAGIAGEGVTGRPGAAEEAIARRCWGALVNAGARLIEAGTARDGATVDAVAISAGIVARWTGGPMHQADQRGLMVVRRDLRVWAADAPRLYAPSPLFDRWIGDGRRAAD